ncbi:hypothetical protein BKG80_10960 [Mycobacteroides chelonae]|uniref:Uncharacterized protein n=1 Tax=Mycobacteroides immunogenum TaxID=83262 RepID=A0A7V8LSZ5_9MYCO|nr:hypothetical protein [Mycobacteroides immunogenum]OHU38296.1 hypothetical protein BKG80_10960 [Mycobacteroides chelonae]ORA54489.1 hypothetical protein BST24_26830 [Mycobacteroides franklinii]AMT69064.1 hypothetical protein ABG82_00440 [Mycobacteroides immunogenum]ANO02087.1 hypothetical protein BAB75_00445 [Mycobacteroides immunogenum]KIU39835.1 hypothetical protein TL11_14400 [Mycobacteroides immunogenum]
MTETEPPLTHEERLLIVGLYVALSQSQNRTPLGRLGSERSCYADHDIHGLKSLSHKRIPESQMIEGLETC